MVFAREIEGQELTFGVSGKLIMNAVVLYDHQTDTLWSQFLTEAVEGPLDGTRLELLPAQLTTWERWSMEHPDTLLLDRSLSGGPRVDPYYDYYLGSAAGIQGETNPDGRLPPKELVVGLDWGERARAYDFSSLLAASVVNDTYNDEAIVVVFDPDSALSAVYSRTPADGRVLTFEPDQQAMRDVETGSTWSLLSGSARAGPLMGERLRQLRSFVSFWFAWSDFYPDTELYAPEGGA